MTAGRVYDVGFRDVSEVPHAVSSTRWPWGWYWRSLCGERVSRLNRPFLIGAPGSCPDCSRYAVGIRASRPATG